MGTGAEGGGWSYKEDKEGYHNEGKDFCSWYEMLPAFIQDLPELKPYPSLTPIRLGRSVSDFSPKLECKRSPVQLQSFIYFLH